MVARYLLCPGWVMSRTDGDRHHVGAEELARLYCVPMTECVVLPGLRSRTSAWAQAWARDRMAERRNLLDRARSGELVALHPRHDGDYKLPKSTQEEV